MLTLEESLRESLRQHHIARQAGNGFAITGEFRFETSFSGFAGHFPGQPILPAIAQLAAVRHLAELALSRKLVPVGCERMKFRGMVLPQETLLVSMELLPSGQGWQADFSLRKDGGPVAGGLLNLCGQDQ
jgi:3-hydroxyacyl-[acyl-carrier-protein] dehydratase